MTALLALFMLMLAIRGFLAPDAAAAGFGIKIVHPADLFYLRIKADRDLSTALALVGLMALRRPLPLAIFALAGTVQPLCDCLLSLADPRGNAVYALSVHGSAAVLCIGLALFLLREHARSSRR
jgi:uncharacterized protein DUF4267